MPAAHHCGMHKRPTAVNSTTRRPGGADARCDTDEAALPTEVELPNGLAPPTANIRKRKWRKRPPPDEKRRKDLEQVPRLVSDRGSLYLKPKPMPKPKPKPKPTRCSSSSRHWCAAALHHRRRN